VITPGPVPYGRPTPLITPILPNAPRRDSKDRGKRPHVFHRHEWECFLIGVKNGEFDLPVG